MSNKITMSWEDVKRLGEALDKRLKLMVDNGPAGAILKLKPADDGSAAASFFGTKKLPQPNKDQLSFQEMLDKATHYLPQGQNGGTRHD